MKGYINKKFKGLNILVSENILSSFTDKKLCDVVSALFNENRTENIFKKTTYKTIFKSELCNIPCFVKRYTNNNAAKLIKSIFRTSMSLNEFTVANYIVDKGIATPQPLLFAERKKFGAVCESLIAISFLDGAQNLKDFLFERGFDSFAAKKRFFYEFGSLSKKIFENRICQDDYSINNFMIRNEEGCSRIYFIDFERVKIDTEIPDDLAVRLLAKLNRIGKIVSLTDRFRFLKGFMSWKAEKRKSFKTLASKIQSKTLNVLKRDFKRGRLTSLYTCNSFEPIRKGALKGLCLNGYDVIEIEKLLLQISDKSSPFQASLSFSGSEKNLRIFQFGGQNADKAWSTLSNLIIAGLKADLPDILVQGKERGIVAFEDSSFRSLKQTLSSEMEKKSFLTDNFKEEVNLLSSFLSLE
jgi:tRNA A-37 threonylcarbamoyl transferase component Bud32